MTEELMVAHVRAVAKNKLAELEALYSREKVRFVENSLGEKQATAKEILQDFTRQMEPLLEEVNRRLRDEDIKVRQYRERAVVFVPFAISVDTQVPDEPLRDYLEFLFDASHQSALKQQHLTILEKRDAIIDGVVLGGQKKARDLLDKLRQLSLKVVDA